MMFIGGECMSISLAIILMFIFLAIGICSTYFIMNTIFKKKILNRDMMYWSILSKLFMQKNKSEQDSKAKNEYLANMAHDIRTPINTVLGMNEMILRENTNVEINEYSNNIKRASNILVELVNDILDISKIESGNMELLEDSYEVGELLNDVITVIKDKCKKKNLQLVVNVDKSIPSQLYGDENKIKQVLLNLLTNAVKYTQSGTVTFEIKVMNRNGSDNVELYVAVEDTGSGIQQENLKSIFSSFKRIDEIRNTKIEGTGLGLNIVYNLLKLMKSKIEVQSEYGTGSRFYFLLDQKIINNRPIGEYLDSFNSQINRKNNYKVGFIAPEARILVVDDNEMNLLVASKLLKDTQMKIDIVSSGFGCLAKINEKKYNLILMDIKMPELDGVETLRRIRGGNSINVDTPVIALTADVVAGVKEKYLKEGFIDYIAKPIDAKKFESKVGSYIPKRLCRVVKGNSDKIINNNNLINMAKGLEFCSNDREMYDEILSTYLQNGLENMKKIMLAYGNEDWTNYSIHIHSLKSTSLTIGAEKLSSLAKQLEEAADKGDIQFIAYNNDIALDMYKSVLLEIERYISSKY